MTRTRTCSRTCSRTVVRWCCLLALLAAGAGPASAATVRIGVLAWLGAEASATDWSPLAARLTERVPGSRFELRHLDLEGLREAVARREVEFVLTNSGQYVTLEAELGLSRIVTLSRTGVPTPERALGSALIVRGDARLQTLADVRGLTVAAVSPVAFGGYLVAARELLQHGVDLEAGDARLAFVGLPMQGVVEAVLAGRAEVGIVRACLLETLVARGELAPGALKVLAPRADGELPCAHSTALYPDWPLATARHTDRELAKAVATALLAMPPTADGLAWGVPADYQPVHELYRALKTGPYAALRLDPWQALAQRYWPVLLLVVLGLALFIAHAVRVEHLVKQRTRELSAALAARRAAEARMNRQQEEAEHLARLSILGELSGTLAHELNQPLATIATYAQGLRRRAAAGTLDAAALGQASGEIAAQAERAGGIIQRIRAFARKRAAVREARLAGDLVREAVALFEAMMPGLPSVAIADVAGPSGRVQADPLLVQQVLLNLLKNAADATEGLAPERRLVAVHVEREADWVRVSVLDRGPGVAAALETHLFEPFFTTKPNGLGLGLSICKSIVEAHGGRLTAGLRDDGPGLCLSFTLPAGGTP